MSMLSDKELKDYKDNGFVAPIDVLSLEETEEIKKEIEHIEKKWPDELVGLGRNNVHYISPIFDRVCHNSKILDAVESIIGKDILVGGTTLFIKDPDKKGFVSWHQDAKYIGFEPYNWVTAWLAITDTNEENGCSFYKRVPALATEENFIKGLTELVLQKETKGNYVSSIMCPDKYKKCPCLAIKK